MKRATLVCGLLLKPGDRTVLMIKRRDHKWYLPGGPVTPSGSEQSQLAAYMLAQTGFTVEVEKPVGPLHESLNGLMKAYDCTFSAHNPVTDPEVIDVEYVTLDKLRSLEVPDPAHRRAALDGLTTLQPPDVVGPIDEQYEEHAPIEAILVGDDTLTLLQVLVDKQLTWRRLDMTAP